MNKTYAIWSSGVDRWHANRSHALRRSCDTTDAHTARCLHLLFALWPDNDMPPMALVKSVLDHDVPEAWTGDTPSPAKEFPGIRDILHDAERIVGESLCLSQTADLTDQFVSWVKLIDNLDAYLWAWRVDPREASRPELASLRERILLHARNTDVALMPDKLIALMDYAEGGGTRPETLE